MKRRIVQHGSSSLTVSLPYKWAKRYGLNKGDEVELEEKGNSVCIKIREEKTSHKATFTIENKDTFLRRYIISLYKQGYDEIEIISKDGLPLRRINDVLNELLGFEIIEQGLKRCVIRNVAQASDAEFDPMLRRAFLVTISLANGSLEAIKGKKFDELKELSKIQYTNNKLTNLCQRILNKKGYKDHIKTNYMYSIIDQLEQIGDHYGDLCDYTYHNNMNVDGKVIQLFENVNNLFEFTYRLFYNFDKKRMIELKNGMNKLNKELLDVFGNNYGKQLVLVQYLIQVLERINHIGLFLIDI
ncbi:MAG: phosphate uptake regulator PhoU [Nanoarchaeota archaeon]|nr:phosphate uptake regulator PhoU [Nanoarchaeota archaeon]MBU1004442.1 phosphate uptake regulator PhoU [Nanoarchaeota archaeon]MBU1946671.1 phosphate uptake regulator PhoU [Nanoarchaeota archaeon]